MEVLEQDVLTSIAQRFEEIDLRLSEVEKNVKELIGIVDKDKYNELYVQQSA